MSSPTSGSNAGKRKRNTAGPTSAKDASAIANAEYPPATSDHPTSGLDPTITSRAANIPKIDNASVDAPASKRQRSSTGEKTLNNGNEDVAAESSSDITDRVNRSRQGGEDGEQEQKMAPPPIGKLTHPVGYKTNDPPVGRPIRVYADGVFDLFHLGHMRQLEQAKKAFPEVYLLVGVTGDKETHQRKGLTVLSGQERAETVRHCKWVDEVVENCPWIVTPEFLEEHKIDYVAHDDLPYVADEGDDIYKPIKEQGKFLVTQRTEGVSTTGIITKIVRDYEKYIARQFKRGTSRQELNVSWLKKNELDLKRHVTEMRDAIRSNWSTTGQELGKEIKQFWQASRPGSPARMNSYDDSNKDGSLRSPTALSHLSTRLEIPRATSPGPGIADFAAGYSLGLIGGVRSWMTRSRQTGHDQNGSDSGEDSNDDKSPIRGRSGKTDSLPVQNKNAQHLSESNERAVDAQVKALLDENSKASGA